MSDSSWCDITTENAEELVNFYQSVMGWKKEAIDMGGYNDYVMMKSDGTPIGGICHKRGVNAQYPGGWINYFTVDTLEAALKAVVEKGGKQAGEIRRHGNDSFCVIIDPSGAACALYEKGKS